MTSSPVIRGRIEEGESLNRGISPFQIMESERLSVWPSPSCILPPKTGEEKEKASGQPRHLPPVDALADEGALVGERGGEIGIALGLFL